jgi:hypothetical protein
MLPAINRGTVDVLILRSVFHFGTSIEALPDALALLYRLGVKFVTIGRAGAGQTRETGGLPGAAAR